ncbi:MAG: hypothetical protein J5850_05315, partial [Clostridia bacterium]|nr:hypothetical protein [Clostridia bacterium]
ALRETFRESDHIRFHPIINYGGSAVNTIPDVIGMESYVRGASLEVISRENRKINRALAGSAVAMGANVEIVDRPGYAPLINDPVLLDFACESARALLGEERVNRSYGWSTPCTDMGDIASVIPSIQPCIGGAVGKGHGEDYRIVDPVLACVVSAEVQLCIIADLLENSCAKAKKVLSEFKPLYPTKEAFFKAIDANCRDINAVRYGDDGESAEIVY